MMTRDYFLNFGTCRPSSTISVLSCLNAPIHILCICMVNLKKNIYIYRYIIYVYVELYTLEIHPGNLKGIGCPFNKNDAKPPLNVSPDESQGKSRPRNPTMKQT